MQWMEGAGCWLMLLAGSRSGTQCWGLTLIIPATCSSILQQYNAHQRQHWISLPAPSLVHASLLSLLCSLGSASRVTFNLRDPKSLFREPKIICATKDVAGERLMSAILCYTTRASGGFAGISLKYNLRQHFFLLFYFFSWLVILGQGVSKCFSTRVTLCVLQIFVG